MLKRLLTVALLAGVLSGLAVSVVQQFTTTPLILHAETYENASLGGAHDAKRVLAHGAKLVLAHSGGGDGQHAPQAWAPEDGLERMLYTVLANVIAGVGFGLILAACFALWQGRVDGRRGVLWGIAGFATFSLAPSLGLPPELPGSMAAALEARQLWWLACVGATALGLGLMVFANTWTLRVAGILALVAPHAVGAPHPAEIGGAVPPELAGHFAAASLIVSAVFWSILGWVAGTLYGRAADDAR